MLIKEIRDYTKDVPQKKIILDQMDSSDVSRLVMQIAGYAALDSIRGRNPEDQILDSQDVDEFIQNVVSDLNKLSTESNLNKALYDAQTGKI